MSIAQRFWLGVIVILTVVARRIGKAIANEHGSTLKLTSELGKGSTFPLSLPVNLK